MSLTDKGMLFDMSHSPDETVASLAKAGLLLLEINAKLEQELVLVDEKKREYRRLLGRARLRIETLEGFLRQQIRGCRQARGCGQCMEAIDRLLEENK